MSFEGKLVRGEGHESGLGVYLATNLCDFQYSTAMFYEQGLNI